MQHIVKCYGDLVANDDVSLTLGAGEILAVIGENGAGKTTLMKILYGMEQPTSGSLFLNGKEIHMKDASHAISHGIGMVQQHFMLFDPFTVAQNVVYGREPKKGLFFDTKRANTIIQELSVKYDLPLDPQEKIQGMPVGLRQRVEILKVLYQNADIIIFDEPTAVLIPQEVHELLKTMRKLADNGKSIIIITHKLNEVMEVADRAMVMRAGKQVADVLIKDTSIEELSYMMVGRHLVKKEVPVVAPAEDVLRIEDLYVKGTETIPKLDHISLHVSAGEIVGIAGVSGNGQSDLEKCIFGLQKIDGGHIRLKGKEIGNLSVKEVRAAGISMIPEDRYLWGSASEATIMETAIMAHYHKPALSHKGILKMSGIKEFSQGIVEEFSVKTDSIQLKTNSLSGGNAQKLIAAREITQRTPLLLACEPTRGVDIGAMEFIHDRLIQKRSEGDAVLLISSELTEIMDLSDRIYVMYDGKINGEFKRGKVKEEELGFLMVGGSNGKQ
jgi:simple sugar transport system ATP-binding protein